MSTVAKYLDRAVSTLRTLGVAFPVQESPVLAILGKTSKYDATRVAAIASTLQQSTVFNAAIRDQLQGMDISTRYADIANSFSSIREDSQKMVEWMADGKMDLQERMAMAWMRMRRGSLPDRFNAIRDTYLDVAKSANDQISRENLILEAYRDFRMALKASEVDAQELLKIAEESLSAKKTELEAASTAVEQYTGSDGAEKARLEMTRDEALRSLQDEDKSFQVVKDIADDLKTSYSAAELVFARLQQTHVVKERLYQRSVTFFATNEVVFTGLAASFTASSGLSEATNAMDAMKDGMNAGLESLATVGSKQLEAGLKSGYGSTLQASSVKALADAVVEFQTGSLKLIDELRQQSTQSAAEIESVTEDAKRRFSALIAKG